MNLYNKAQVYQLDRLAIEQDAQPSKQLMAKAALAVWRSIQLRWPIIQKVVVFAGNGNNGGDAFALASLMQESGIEVDLIAYGDLSLQSEESSHFRANWEQNGGFTRQWEGSCPDADLIVDGLLGIGLSRELDESWKSVIISINDNNAIRVSIDIPSGLNADTGISMPVAIKAELTVTFIGRKQGCFLADGPDYCGEIVFDDLGISQEALSRQVVNVQTLEPFNIQLPSLRSNNSYKNQFGHVLVIGGGKGMSGAARLSGYAALRCGAGLVSLCVHADNVVAASVQYAELMVSSWDLIDKEINRASVIVVGPGLGDSSQATEILNRLSTLSLPMVIDADALQTKFIDSLTTGKCVLTPHPGEAARLLQTSTLQIQQDRVATIKKLNNKWPVVSVLKGAGSLVGLQHNQLKICQHGHSGMATAGMGDVLSGIIAAFLAQGLTPLQAAQTGVLVHALAAEYYATEQDAACLIASDVIDRVSRVVRDIRQLSIF